MRQANRAQQRAVSPSALMEKTGERSGLGTHTEDISPTCTHMAFHLTHIAVIQTAHNLTETFSGYERTIFENDEEHLLLA